MTSGFSNTHVFSFDKYPELYLKAKEMLRIKKGVKIEIVEDKTMRRPAYSISSNLAFPHLYANGEMSPLDFSDYKLSRYLLKKQTLFAHQMCDGKFRYHYTADDIHLAHSFARLTEQTVNASVGYYLSQHPQAAHLPIDNVINAFKQGVNERGLLDSHLPDLTAIMAQIPNSREGWYSQRLGIETMSRDMGEPNLFLMLNMDPRAWPDVRRLLYELEHGVEAVIPNDYFIKNAEEFTEVMNKFAPQVEIYLYRKAKIMLKAFLTDICGIPEVESSGDWTQQDKTDACWYWYRVEWTQYRVCHYHAIVRLPRVLDTGLLGRMIQNARVVRQEMKCGNIKPAMKEEAWRIIEIGLLATRYVTLFADSIAMASFYTEHLDSDSHQPEKVIELEQHRRDFQSNYVQGNISRQTHPIMRTYNDVEQCDPNIFIEMAKVASVSCIHDCIGVCGGDPKTGKGCRFEFPKKKMNYTVPAIMQVNSKQMEARILLRRTCGRTANLNKYLIRYWRANHDVTPLIDSSHKLRYCAKYATKSQKSTELLDEVIEHLNKRSTDLLPPNLKQVLSHLMLAECSHRAFITKQELAYRVMNLPLICKSFSDVSIVGFYKRGNITVANDDKSVIEFSDRTEYSAYAERCRKDTQLRSGLTEAELAAMTLYEFAATVNRTWVRNAVVEEKDLGNQLKRTFRSRDINSGHWLFSKNRVRRHLRPSTVLYTAPAIEYEPIEIGTTTTQTTFFDLPVAKRNQLYRAYYELVMYVPWQNTPDETFLDTALQQLLNSKTTHAEIDSRHSLMKLEQFFEVYKRMSLEGLVAPAGSCWHRDNQFSLTMFLNSQHNRDMHLDRSDNDGMLIARYENADELVDVNVQPRIVDETDDYEYPTFQNFIPPDTFRGIMEQKPPELNDIAVSFPLNPDCMALQELMTFDKFKRFIAKPPPAPVKYDEMSDIQRWAVDLGCDEKQKVLLICGVAGAGKTSVALQICEHFKGRVQCGSITGKAASNFNGPTIHSMFGWSIEEFDSASNYVRTDSRKILELRAFYENISVFIFDEVFAMTAASLALLHETMTAIFNPDKEKDSYGKDLPFGNKKVIMLGDEAQLRPVGGAAIYDDGVNTTTSGQTTNNYRSRGSRLGRNAKRTKEGQLLYQNYLVPNCVFLNRRQRNRGLLGEICDRLRQGTLSEEDSTKLTYQR